jgi:hypothetical protein
MFFALTDFVWGFAVMLGHKYMGHYSEFGLINHKAFGAIMCCMGCWGCRISSIVGSHPRVAHVVQRRGLHLRRRGAVSAGRRCVAAYAIVMIMAYWLVNRVQRDWEAPFLDANDCRIIPLDLRVKKPQILTHETTRTRGASGRLFGQLPDAFGKDHA